MEEKIVKDGEIEVSSDEAGFEGAWFLGVLEDTYPTNSLHTKLRVRYLTLLDEDGSSPLIEHVEPRFIRPVPSEDRYIDLVLVQGSTVDANHKDGWWTGLVIRKLDDETFLVYFNSPPDIIQFHRNQLRPHLNWNGSDFYPLGIEEVDTSTFSSGSKVEVTSTGIAWYPAIIIKEIEVDGEKKKFIVKFSDLTCSCEDTTPNWTVDSCQVRPVPPPSSVEQEFSVVDCVVEAFRDSGWPRVWHQGSVMGVLDDNRYVVCLESSKEKQVFNHSELRLCKMWENGVWHDGAMPKSVKETPSNITKMKPLRSWVGAKPRASKRATNSRNLEDNGDTSSTAKTAAETNSTRKRKRKEKDKKYPKETDGAYDGSNAEINDTSNNICNDDDDADGLPLTPWISVSPNSSEIKLSLDQSQIVGKNAAAATDVEETQAKDTPMVLPPFAKTLPLWKTCETHEVTQSPHFSSLFKTEENVREFAAIGMMLNLPVLLEEVKDLQLDASSSKLSSLRCHLDELEKNGFDVATPRSRINKILSLQDVKAKQEEERKHVEEKIEAEEMEIHRFEEEMVELNRKMLELKEKKEVAEKRKVEMKTYAETIDQKIEDLELEFKTTP